MSTEANLSENFVRSLKAWDQKAALISDWLPGRVNAATLEREAIALEADLTALAQELGVSGNVLIETVQVVRREEVGMPIGEAVDEAVRRVVESQ